MAPKRTFLSPMFVVVCGVHGGEIHNDRERRREGNDRALSVRLWVPAKRLSLQVSQTGCPLSVLLACALVLSSLLPLCSRAVTAHYPREAPCEAVSCRCVCHSGDPAGREGLAGQKTRAGAPGGEMPVINNAVSLHALSLSPLSFIQAHGFADDDDDDHG